MNEAEVNLALGNMYGKKRKAYRAAGNLPERRAMKYVPYAVRRIDTRLDRTDTSD